MTRRTYPKTKMGGMEFTRVSLKERAVTHGGRHFFAIGADGRGWTLFEFDQDITSEGEARHVGRKFERLLDNKALAAEIRRLVETGEALPTDWRPPWEIDEPRFRENQAELERQREAKKQERINRK